METIFGKTNIIYKDGKKEISLNGYYLIVIKTDCLIIHGNNGIKPILSIVINKKSVIIKSDNKIQINISKTKYLSIGFDEVLFRNYNGKETGNKLELSRKEKDVKKIILEEFIKNGKNAIQEFQTPYGNIDIMYSESNIFYIFELKNNRIKKDDINQVIRYGDYFIEQGFNIKMYLIGEKINENDKIYSTNKNVNILKINDIFEKGVVNLL